MLTGEQPVVVDPQEWVDASAEDLYGGDRLIPVVHEHTNEFGQTLRMLVVDGGADIHLSPLSLDHRINPLTTRREQVKAKQEEGLFAVIETPGVTMNQNHPLNLKGAFQIPTQTFSALAGDLRPIAREQLKAAIKVLGLKDGQEIQIDGESLAADVVVAWLQVIASGELGIKLEVTNVNLNEIINRSEKNKLLWARGVLQKLVKIEGPLAQRYLEENTTIGHNDALPFEQISRANARAHMALRILQFPFSYVPALGLSNGIDLPLKDAMKDPLHNFRDTKFSIRRGNASSVSDEGHSEHIAEVIKHAGGSVERVKLVSAKGNPTEVGHSFGLSLGRTSNLARWQKKNS